MIKIQQSNFLFISIEIEVSKNSFLAELEKCGFRLMVIAIVFIILVAVKC